MSYRRRQTLKGRGSSIDPPNRFEAHRHEEDFEHLQYESDLEERWRKRTTEFLPDHSKSIISENDSPDVGFRFSLNPYRGCEHGCAYCYARPTHEYLGLNAGLDFETRILYKPDAPRLFEAHLAKRSWQGEPVALSGVTDCYQPIERKLVLTRGCIDVALACRQPLIIITKNSLLLRDLAPIAEMAALQLIHVFLSVPTLDPKLASTLEPRAPRPESRLRAIEELTNAGVSAGVMVAPVIPGLTDHEIPAILKAARDAGAIAAGKVLLRLPHAVRPIFLDWLSRHAPDRASRVEQRIMACRDGKLNDTRFSKRLVGSGPIAEQIQATFNLFRTKLGFRMKPPPLDSSQFRRPRLDGQLTLFEE
ncbi:Radical SAM superfamily protein [Planctomycetes bacterium Pan216]|uniref:Radical SAM superfamily protein n=1 Tax=Kolteria novifilia TaxID=2527975 RepID=A0A518B513_9BACT|nr:Radical SAM superfamily protein [Planctomycetes bacterium Pan216]